MKYYKNIFFAFFCYTFSQRKLEDMKESMKCFTYKRQITNVMEGMERIIFTYKNIVLE